MGQLKQMLRAQILAEMTYDRQMSDEEIAELIDRRMDACMEEQPDLDKQKKRHLEKNTNKHTRRHMQKG